MPVKSRQIPTACCGRWPRNWPGTGYYVLVPNAFYRHGLSPVIALPGRRDR